VGSFVAITVFLRQRGSAESKAVGAPHELTGVEGTPPRKLESVV